MQVVSVNLGSARPHPAGDGRLTGIYKEPVDAIEATAGGVVGDAVMNTRHHGGPSKAICVYCGDHYSAWRERYPEAGFAPGTFGENLTVSGWDESACLGDLLRIGAATVQVSQPRGPCATLAARLGIADFVAVCLAANWTGWYLRVIEPGIIRAGDPIELVSPDEHRLSIARANRIAHARPRDAAQVAELLAVEALAPEWRRDLGG